MATDTPNPQTGEASNAQPEGKVSEDSKPGLRKNAEMPPELDQLMQELAGDTSSGGASTLGRLERRVNMLETAFADIVQRHESSLRDRSAKLAAVEESVAALRKRLDESHKDHTAAATALRSTLGEVGVRLNGIEAQRQEAPVIAAPQPAEIESHVVESVAPDAYGEMQGEPGEMEADALQDAPQDAPPVETRGFEGPSYLSAARRAAIASVRDGDVTGRPAQEAPRRKGRTRLLLVGCAAPLMVLAGAVFFINRHPVTAHPATAQRVAAPAALRASDAKRADVIPAAPANAAPVDPANAAPADPANAAAAAPANAVAAAPANAAPAPQAKLTPPPDVAVAAPADPTPADITSTAASNELAEKASHGDVVAARDLGLKYLAGNGVTVNDDEAVSWILRAAYKGEPAAEYWLGTLYARGRGVPVDASQALHWYEAAAKQGNGKAMHRLGLAYFQGRGVDKNEKEAARWFSQAAELGNMEAAFNLAVLYERGTGVKQSLVDAYKWYAIAAHEGRKDAASRVELLSKQLQPADLAAATHEAADFKPQSSAVANSK
jgi:localization factor PodJL